MTSRERVKAALNHKQPDKVPVSLGAHICDAFTKFAKDNYEEHLGFEKTPHLITHKAMWGAFDVQKILPFGTPQEIDDEIRRLVDVLGKDGGYILSPAHNVQALVPGENIDAMRKAMLRHRGRLS